MILYGLTHIVLSAFLALILGWSFGSLNALFAVMSLLGSGLLLLCLRAQLRELSGLLPTRPFDWLEKLIACLVFAIGLRHFMWLFYETNTGFLTLAATNLGDLPLHINYIRQFAGASFPPVNPEFSAQPLYYPFALDLYNALWEMLGIPLSTHLFLTGIFLLLASIVMLHHWAGWVGLAGFFFNGGWIGWQIWQTGVWTDYQSSLPWKNFFLSLFVPQRGLMIAIPLGLVILMIVRALLVDRKNWLSDPSLYLLGVLWGLLAFFHLHSFVAVSLILGCFAVIHNHWRPLLTAALTAVPIGSFFVMYSTEFLQKASVIYLQWGWLAQDEGLFEFWWQNTGPWLLLLAITVLVLTWRRAQLDLFELTIYLLLFALFNVVMMAPWDWDNIKLIIWPYLGFLALAWKTLPEQTAIRRKPLLIRASISTSLLVAAFVLGFSGLVSVLSTLNPRQDSVTVYNSRELWFTQGAVDGLSPDAVFVAAPTYNHPLTFLGRIRVLGYEGHTWSHGIDSTDVANRQIDLYTGSSNWREHLAELGATHIFLGPHELAQYGRHTTAWTAELNNVSPVADYAVYEIAEAPAR